MKTVKILLIFIGLMISLVISQAQSNINVSIESNTFLSTNKKLQPHYNYSNRWGVVHPLKSAQGVWVTGINYRALELPNFNLSFGGSVVVADKFNDSFLHEAYLNAKFFNVIDINLGKQAYSPLQYNEEQIMVGAFMRSNNARPIPRAQIGFFEYVPVGFLSNWIEIKGGLSHGVLNDDRFKQGRGNEAENIQAHEKWAFVRLGKNKKHKPYIGLFHGALMGGERANGTKIPVDYWATFFSKGSEKIGGGEATNAAGAHDGYWDLGINSKNKFGDIHFYLNKPYADRSGLFFWQLKNRDYKIGITASLKKGKIVRDINIEAIRTDYQAGYGLPDPLYPKGHPKEGQIIFLPKFDDYDEFMKDVFGLETQGYDKYDVRDYMIEHLNNGWIYGARDDYNNNGMYYHAWTYHNQSMGLPLYHTYSQVNAYAPEWNVNNHGIFINNRIRGFHLGVKGGLLEGLNYVLKTTYTNNKGSYAEEFLRRYSWEEDPDFYYKGGKMQMYNYFELKYKKTTWTNFEIKGAVSFDFGELYDAWGVNFGLKYTPKISL